MSPGEGLRGRNEHGRKDHYECDGYQQFDQGEPGGIFHEECLPIGKSNVFTERWNFMGLVF
jgi:hypothetical protein